MPTNTCPRCHRQYSRMDCHRCGFMDKEPELYDLYKWVLSKGRSANTFLQGLRGQAERWRANLDPDFLQPFSAKQWDCLRRTYRVLKERDAQRAREKMIAESAVESTGDGI